MEINARTLLPTLLFTGLAVVGLMGLVAAERNPEAAKLKNPVATSAESIAAGEKLYMRRCRSCHGRAGTGGPAKDAGDAPASNLVDGVWDFGSTDGEIYYVIRNGVEPALIMEPWDDRIDETETWQIVNYLRSIAEK
jgi:mono/diheme cytochrome c family protein